MKLHLNNFVKAVIVILNCSILIWAESTREKIAVIPINAEMSATKEAALTEKILDELFKMDLFVVCEQSQVKETMIAEVMNQSGCSDKICATMIGELLGAQKVIFGTIKRKDAEFKITLKMADVKTGDIIRKSSLSVAGNYNDVLTKGMMRVTRGLIGTFFSKHEIAGSKSSSSTRGRNVTKISAVFCAGACVGFGSASAYYWSRKKRFEDENQEVVDEATVRGAVFTAASAASLVTSIILFVIKPKNSNVSVNTNISPEYSAVSVTCSF